MELFIIQKIASAKSLKNTKYISGETAIIINGRQILLLDEYLKNPDVNIALKNTAIQIIEYLQTIEDSDNPLII